jgi:hypothetical protein
MPLRSTGWFIDSEILYWIGRNKLRFCEIPITIPPREAGTSKVALTDPLHMLRELDPPQWILD